MSSAFDRAAARAVALLALATVAFAACATPRGATLRQLQQRAVFDLGCPAHRVAVYHLDARTKAAAGCGRRLVYVESCDMDRAEPACTWVLDSPTYGQADWPAWSHGPAPTPPGAATTPHAPWPAQPSQPAPAHAAPTATLQPAWPAGPQPPPSSAPAPRPRPGAGQPPPTAPELPTDPGPLPSEYMPKEL